METAGTTSRFLTISNLLSISRAVLAVPFVIIMLSSVPYARLWGLGIIALGALTDRLDGVLARKYNQITEWGKILDPLADKVGVAAVGAVLVIRQEIPSWFLAALIGRDVLIFLGGMYLKLRKGIVLPSNIAGKWTIGVVAVTLALALLEVRGTLMIAGLVLSSIMLAVSLALYVQRFVAVMGKQRTPHGIS